MKVKIYHSYGPDRFEEVEDQPRKQVAEIDAENLEDAYKKSQNIDETWNPKNPCRSTSVGDVLEIPEGFYMVCNTGFKLLDKLSQNDSELLALENQTIE